LFLCCLLGLAGCAGSAPPASARADSVLLVTIDTLRADRLGCYGDAEARTPVVDRLAGQGVLFERAFTPAPITLPAHASLMTGQLPPAHGVRGNGGFVLPRDVPTLAEALRAAGLQTAAFVGGFPLERRFGLGRGFDVYDDAFERAAGVHFEFAERRALAVVDVARAWLRSHPGRAFVWVHLFDPHAPYDPPPTFRGNDPYRGEIAAADGALGLLLADWDARPEASLIVITSDHGEAFGEHGEESHSIFVYDTTLRVPLVLRGPGLPAGRRVAAPVGLVDVAATVADAVGTQGLPGRSLLPLARGGAAGAATGEGGLYAETLAPRLDFGWSELRAWRDGRLKYIHAPRPELYDVEADAGETRDLAAARPEDTARLRGALEGALAASGERRERRPADAETAEKLRALGYVQGPEAAGSGADPKDKLEIARLIARAGGPFEDHAAAARAYAAIAKRDPDIPVVNLRLADALLRSGDAAGAVGHYRRVVAARPVTADAHVGLATAYAEQGRLRDAGAVLREAVAAFPTNGQVQFNLGELARAKGDAREARARYEKALADPVTRERARQRLESLR
jgi:Flp pilus assembly protein TadD